jgi:hypothetical protein
LPAESPCREKSALVVFYQNVRTGNGVAYAECQVEDHLMSIKKLVIVAKALVHREVCGRFTPSGVGRVERLTGP